MTNKILKKDGFRISLNNDIQISAFLNSGWVEEVTEEEVTEEEVTEEEVTEEEVKKRS